MDDNKARERAFHDARFRENIDPRHKLGKYYAVTGASNALFKQVMTDHSGPGKLTLEYGCGTAGDLAFYKSIGSTLYGIDISREAIIKAEAEAARQGLDAHYSVQDAEHTNFPDAMFDLVAGAGILHHLDLDKSLRELARITKPGGACVFSEPLGHNPVINLYRSLTPTMRTPDEHPLLDKDISLMQQHFGTVSVKYFYLLTMAAVLFRKTSVFDAVYRRLLAADEALIRWFPRLAKHAWICIITLKAPRRHAQPA